MSQPNDTKHDVEHHSNVKADAPDSEDDDYSGDSDSKGIHLKAVALRIKPAATAETDKLSALLTKAERDRARFERILEEEQKIVDAIESAQLKEARRRATRTDQLTAQGKVSGLEEAVQSMKARLAAEKARRAHEKALHEAADASYAWTMAHTVGDKRAENKMTENKEAEDKTAEEKDAEDKETLGPSDECTTKTPQSEPQPFGANGRVKGWLNLHDILNGPNNPDPPEKVWKGL